MIPLAYITEWRAHAPWSSPDMVEQDLILSRALLAIYSDPFLRARLAFRGGTALYKLCLVPPARYSEDLDLIQLNAEPIRETLDHLHDALDPWLGSPRYEATAQSARLTYRFDAESTPGVRPKLKVEINTREHTPISRVTTYPFTVASSWVHGQAEIVSYGLNELLGTKLRALYQRKKGRDLFDLDYALRVGPVEPSRIAEAFVYYLGLQENHVTATQFRQNLAKKMADPSFGADVAPLLGADIAFALEEASERVDRVLISLIDSAWEQSLEVATPS